MGILDDLILRHEWGAKYGVDRMLALSQKTEMHVHHTVIKCPGSGKCDDTLRLIESQHHNQWGYSLGYNILRCHDGFFEGCGVLRRGQHCPNHNTSSFGVAYVGDGREPLPAYFGYDLGDDLKRVWDELSNRRGRRLYLYGHRDHRATLCPGDTLYHEVHYGFPSVGQAPAPAPTPTPTPPGVGLEKVMDNPALAKGSQGQHVRILQGLLIAHAEPIVAMAAGGFSELHAFVDGNFGDQTEAALTAWQRATETLVPDGVCGPRTWAWLCGLPVA
jgi:hypothetical protein